MIIKKKISEFLVFENETVLRALEKINTNKKRILFVVAESGHLVGSFADGDFRRWVTSTANLDLNRPVSEVMYTSVRYQKVDASKAEIEPLFTHAIDIIPLVDSYGRLVAVALAREKGFSIGGRTVSDNDPAYVIAEIGNNHQGDLQLAKQLVDLAAEAGADCIKFQMRHMETLYKAGSESDQAADLGAQYTMDLLSKFQLSNSQLFEVFDYVKTKGATPLCTPWDMPSLAVLEDYGMPAYKVASADFTNTELLQGLVNTGKPLICSTGMSTEAEIKHTVEFLRSRGAEFVLLHCNSTYPTPFKDVNLAYLPRLKELSGGVVGYSGHERGVSVPVAAVAMGAKVIEKHFTIDKTLEGNDHKVSLLPPEFTEMVKKIREVEEAMGKGEERELTQGEMINREVLAKSLMATRDIQPGEAIRREWVEVKSPGQGLQPMYLDQLLGRVAHRPIAKGECFFDSDIKGSGIQARNYHFTRPFGIPVRYHDYEALAGLSNLDFVEFHLSYQDLDLDFTQYIKGVQDIGFAVHSPELFAGDHIMDLASDNTQYRQRSIDELNRVCETTRALKAYFPKTERPVIVVNAGGANPHGFIAASEKADMYQRVAEALKQVDQTGVEVVIQTMPPFPWHFGGQSYHNLFVSAEDIDQFCGQYNVRICFDVSHSMMACNYFQWNLDEFTQKVAPYTAHMHIVDAKGIDGEGIEIGKGDVNFAQLAQNLEAGAPGVQFIPEVWQGHKNRGEGFWRALDYLEKLF